MLRITGIKIRIPHDSKALTEEVRRRAKGQKPLDYRIVRRSVDARKKPDLYYVYTIDASFKEEKKLLELEDTKLLTKKAPKVAQMFAAADEDNVIEG